MYLSLSVAIGQARISPQRRQTLSTRDRTCKKGSGFGWRRSLDTGAWMGLAGPSSFARRSWEKRDPVESDFGFLGASSCRLGDTLCSCTFREAANEPVMLIVRCTRARADPRSQDAAGTRLTRRSPSAQRFSFSSTGWLLSRLGWVSHSEHAFTDSNRNPALDVAH